MVDFKRRELIDRLSENIWFGCIVVGALLGAAMFLWISLFRW